MKQEGYVIARGKQSKEYFTSRSAYDRAEWVKLNEAATYETPEIAAQAARRLWRAGVFEATVVPLKEISLDMEMPSDERSPADKKSEEKGMVAQQQENPEELEKEKGVCPECNCDPCECDHNNMEEPGEESLPGEEGLPGEEECELTPVPMSSIPGQEDDEKALSPVEAALSKGKRYQTVPPGTTMEGADMTDRVVKSGGMWMVDREDIDTGKTLVKPGQTITFKHGGKKYKGRVSSHAVGRDDDCYELSSVQPLNEATEFKMPKAGDDPAKPEDNDTTAANMKDPKHEEIKFADRAREDDEAETNYECDEKVEIPATIKQQLKDAIADFTKDANDNVETDNDARASHALTVKSALETLLKDLESGTVEGLKQAQVHYSSMMNPITTHIPPDVRKFIEKGGQKMSLKDLFNVKWDEVRRQNRI